jgi:hypothetical protein
MERLWRILERAGDVMPATQVYNEGNTLALVLDACERHGGRFAPRRGT